MIVPSGKGSFLSRYALVATSLPKTAPILLMLPPSWDTEINLQSRYPGGISFTKIGAAALSVWPDTEAMWPTTAATATTATSKRSIRFIRFLLDEAGVFRSLSEPQHRSLLGQCPFFADCRVWLQSYSCVFTFFLSWGCRIVTRRRWPPSYALRAASSDSGLSRWMRPDSAR